MGKDINNKYYQIAAKGSHNIAHPAIRILKTIADNSLKILDLGCGEGTRLNYLAKEEGTGVDINKTAITLAKKKYPRHRFLVGDLSHLPLKKENFDLVYSAYVFEHLAKPEKVIGQAIKVLDKNGKLVIIAPNYGSPNRASPPYKGNRLAKLIRGFGKDFFKTDRLSWNKVKPITGKYEIDYDTVCEPYLGSLISFLEKQGLRILYADSCWNEELPEANLMQKVFRYLGERGIDPFKNWGPHLIIVAQKPGAKEKCVFCGGKNFRDLFKIGYSVIEVCRSCGLIRTDGLITESYEVYHREGDYQKYEKHFENIFTKIYSDITSVIKDKGRVLEIGCSTGLLLSIFKKEGWEVWGVEPSAAAKIAEGCGIKIIHSTLEAARLPDSYFDLVILNHTLEHLEEPIKAIKKSYRLLKKDGHLFIGVPNAGSLSANILKSHWSYVAPHEHRLHFYPAILEKILVACGFNLVFVKARSGIFTLAHPWQGLVRELGERPRNFLSDLISTPIALVEMILNSGTSLSIIGQK